MNARPTFEISIDTKLLYDELIASKAGDVVTYQQLGKAVSRVVTGGDPYLQSALHRAFKNDDAVFDNVRSVGYRRLTDAEIVKLSTKDTDTIRRRSRRAGEKLTKVVDFSALPLQQRIEHNARLSIFSAIAAMTKPSSVKKIETHAAVVDKQLALAETLEAFKRA